MSENTSDTRSGLDAGAMDTSIRPQDDLFGFVNGTWLATTEIPEDKGRYGSFDMLREKAAEDVRVILDEVATDAGHGASDTDGDDVRGKVGAFYASFLDAARADELGLAPVEADLAAIRDAADLTELWRVLGRLQREGVGGAVAVFVDTDSRDSSSYIAHLEQSGIGLPDESYYREEGYAELRGAYERHLAAMGRLVADAGATDGFDAGRAYELEIRLAGAHWDRVRCRDAVATYTKFTLAELEESAPAVPWRAWFEALGAPADRLTHIVVRQPSYLEGLSETCTQVPLDQWKAWAVRRIVGSMAPFLSAPFVAENFDFYGRTLTGTPQQRQRWKRGVDLVGALLGEAVGQLYVERHFPPQAKERMVELVDNLIEAYRIDIADLEWMSGETKAKALDKLAAFVPKIGYPDEWRDYSGLEVREGDLVGNVRRAHAFETDRDWRKLGSPVDRGEWFMPPQTVNAYYNPGMNEIVFPAAILQPPFFDAEADDAVNYGAIGSVIGHEIGHGFDDQGSRYDGVGNLDDWWTADDRAAFEELTGKLIAQYDALEPRDLPGEHVNGALTVGENIGDLGGVTIAHLAYRLSLGEGGLDSAPVIDGLTGEQRLFAGWAQVWRGKARPEEAKRLLAIDPHSPSDLRANIVANLAEFVHAYDVKPGDGMWLDPADRVRIW
ncbi:M13 family metallopeptidase [Mobilicoccus pelagius]|uniref:Putative metalloendopeptidase n=1 Tax=Mobilicoccus pelagius NBRC 104925 TaxID=1089455 RepID=H5UTA7_9MICO|nr:M13-type metalloendopeptidase [Mobilicoccus pelagius]GAB48965.1 putative metalloendopeptidase [Mobilicoccus pelagius NBRC 104925]